MDEITAEDVRTLYNKTLVLYKDTPVFIHRCDNYKISCEDISTGRVFVAEFSLNDFKPVNSRLGFVNTSLGCTYLLRKPVRLYQVGLTYNNIKLKRVYTNFTEEIEREVATLRCSGIIHAIKNEYPALNEAYINAVALGTTFAFDRQFCVNFDKTVFYRGGEEVGRYDPETDKILFIQGKEYLSSLLDGSYGKNS